MSKAPVVLIQVRHSRACPHRDDPNYRRCNCWKHLVWHYHGKRYRVATKSRTWAGAEKRKREVELEYEQKDSPPIEVPTIANAVQSFLAAKRGENITKNPYDKYRRELADLVAFCERRRLFFVNDVTLPDLAEYRLTWGEHCPSSQTRQAMQGRLRGFFRYLQEAGYIHKSPAAGLKAIKTEEPPVVPLTEEQYNALLAAIPEAFPEPTRAQRVRALIRLMRHTGLAIRDALCLPRAAMLVLDGVAHIATSRSKTGVDVCVPIPDELGEELKAIPNSNSVYFFWTGNNAEAAVKDWQWRNFKTLFKKAAMPTGHSHQLRHTAAVEWLNAGVPLEEVSKLLGHSSIKVTEKTYAAWVKSRQQRLTKLVVDTWEKKERKVPRFLMGEGQFRDLVAGKAVKVGAAEVILSGFGFDVVRQMLKDADEGLGNEEPAKKALARSADELGTVPQ